MKCLAILVNYHTADWLLQAVASLADDPACDRIHVVDNSVCALQAQTLRAGLPARVQLTVAERNFGFAGACNLAFAAEADADCVLLLNPDARLLPGALAQMKATLAAHPSAGAVGPLVYWDDAQRFLLPQPTGLSPWLHLCQRVAQHSALLQHWLSRRGRAYNLSAWQATHPMRVAAHSGGHVLLRTAALHSAGGLFDPTFFMYWEDTDLMLRLRQHGWHLLLEPRARAVHAYTHAEQKDALLAQGWPVYESKHFSTWPWRWLNALLRRLPVRKPATMHWSRLHPCDDGWQVDVHPACQGHWLLELALTTDFMPAVGQFGVGPVARLPLPLVQQLGQRPLYLRLGKPGKYNAQACQHAVLLRKNAKLESARCEKL